MPLNERARKQFRILAWALLIYNLPVILWGAYVRVSFSGDGCGANWPFCNGQVIPEHMGAPMAIELTHRLMTSLDLVAAIALCVGAFLLFPRANLLRRCSVWSLIFLLIEALVGAGLVLLRHVARDQSAGRVWYLSAHLTNTMLLLGALTMTAWASSSDVANFRFRAVPRKLYGALAVAVFVSVTGAIAALGDTLFPAASVAGGMRQDFSASSSALLRLRLLHPLLAVVGAAYLIWAAAGIWRGPDRGATRNAAGVVVGLTVLQLIAGAVNISLLAPVAMQLFHLFMADMLWICLIWLTLKTAQQPAALEDFSRPYQASFSR